MKITNSKIAEYFDWTMDIDFLEICKKVLERVDEDAEDLEDEVIICMESELIYYRDQWTVFAHYNWTNLKYADWDETLGNFIGDLINIAKDELHKNL